MNRIRADIIENADSLSRELKENWIIYRDDHLKFVKQMLLVIIIFSIIFIILKVISNDKSISYSIKILGAGIGTVSVIGLMIILLFCLSILGWYSWYRWRVYQVMNNSASDFRQYYIEFDDKYLIEYESLSSENYVELPWDYFQKYHILTESIKLFVGNRVLRTYSRENLGDSGFDEMVRIVVSQIPRGKDDRAILSSDPTTQ